MADVDQQTIRQVLGGDRDAYGALMQRHFATVFRVSFRITGNHQDAEEVAQETFLRAYDKLSNFRSTASFGTWVYRIAMNCAFDLVRRRCREASWNAAPLFNEEGSERFASLSQSGPERALLESEAVQVRQNAMDQLTPLERTAFVLRHLEEKSIPEIADALGATTSSIKQAVFRAVAKLRLVLKDNVRTIKPEVETVR